MSSDPAAAADGTTIVALFHTFTVQNYVGVAASVLILYEHLITADREIDLFWKHKFSLPAALFLTNRYLILVFSTLTLVSAFDGSLSAGPLVDLGDDDRCSRCNGTTWAREVANLATLIPPAAFSAMRAIALTRSRVFSALVFLLSLGPVAVNVAQDGLGLSGVVDPVFGCLVQVFTPSEQVYIGSGLVASRGSLIVADVLVIAVTWSKLFRETSVRKAFLVPRHVKLADVFLRDGTIYFVLLLILNVLDLIFSFTSTFVEGGANASGSYITLLTPPLTAILISRFLINLQEANLRSVKVDSDDPAYISSHSENSLPSFVAAPGTTRPALGSSVEHCVDAGVVDNRETGEADEVEDETLGVGVPSVEVQA